MSSDGSELNAQPPQQEDLSDSLAQQLSIKEKGTVVKLQTPSPLQQVNENNDLVPSHFCGDDSKKRDKDKPRTSDSILLSPVSDVEGNSRSNSVNSAVSPVETNHHYDEILVAGSSAQHPQPITTAENPSVPDVTGQDWTNPPIPSNILKQRQKLRDKLHFLRTTLGTNGELSTNNRKQKNKRFYELYKIISTLLMNGHFASFIEKRYESLIIASIDPAEPLKDAKDRWHVVIEDSIAFYLDVKGQFLFPQNLFRDETRAKCSSRRRAKNVNMTIRSAYFQGSRLIFTENITKCTDTKSIIYGIRCKECPPGSAASNISYVGQTDKGKKGKRSAHDRHREHQSTSQINKKNLPMYKHAAQDPHTSDFHNTMEMIYLPMASTKNYYNCLNSWECFWQFFCRARILRGGWCKRFPGDPTKKESTNSKKKLGEIAADESSSDQDEDESFGDQEEDESSGDQDESL